MGKPWWLCLFLQVASSDGRLHFLEGLDVFPGQGALHTDPRKSWLMVALCFAVRTLTGPLALAYHVCVLFVILSLTSTPTAGPSKHPAT